MASTHLNCFLHLCIIQGWYNLQRIEANIILLKRKRMNVRQTVAWNTKTVMYVYTHIAVIAMVLLFTIPSVNTLTWLHLQTVFQFQDSTKNSTDHDNYDPLLTALHTDVSDVSHVKNVISETLSLLSTQVQQCDSLSALSAVESLSKTANNAIKNRVEIILSLWKVNTIKLQKCFKILIK